MFEIFKVYFLLFIAVSVENLIVNIELFFFFNGFIIFVWVFIICVLFVESREKFWILLLVFMFLVNVILIIFLFKILIFLIVGFVVLFWVLDVMDI